MLQKLIMSSMIPMAEKYLEKIPQGLDAISKEFGVNECFIMIRKRMVPSDSNPAILKEKGFICIMGVVNGKLSLLEKDGKPAEYPIDRQAIQFITSKISEAEED